MARVREPHAWRPVRRIGCWSVGRREEEEGEEGVWEREDASEGEGVVPSTQEEMEEMREVVEEM